MRMGVAALAFLFLGACGSPAPVADEASDDLPTSAVLMALVAGDVACYAQLRDETGRGREVMATFEICEREELLGKDVELTYAQAQVLAASCQGDPECPETETVRLIDGARETAEPPLFAGEVGHDEAGRALETFLGYNEGAVVDLDLTLSSEVELAADGDEPFFVLWTECDPLEPGEEPSAMKCGGIEVSVRGGDAAADFELRADPPAGLRGRFRVTAFAGPHQGLFAVPLEPLPTS